MDCQAADVPGQFGKGESEVFVGYWTCATWLLTSEGFLAMTAAILAPHVGQMLRVWGTNSKHAIGIPSTQISSAYNSRTACRKEALISFFYMLFPYRLQNVAIIKIIIPGKRVPQGEK